MASESAAYLRLAMNMVVCVPRPGGRLPLQIGVKPAVVIPVAVGVVFSHPTIDTVTINPSVTLVISPTYLWPLHCVLGHGRFRCFTLLYPGYPMDNSGYPMDNSVPALLKHGRDEVSFEEDRSGGNI